MHDFIGIGDIVTDAFIRLKDAAIHCDTNNHQCELCLRFGDKVPYEEAYVVPAVGNSANAAVAAARLGLRSALVSNVGDDYFAEECLDTLVKEKVDTIYMQSHPGQKTNYHYVLWYEDDRTILIKHQDYEYTLPEIGTPKWVYFSSLGKKSLEFHHIIEKYLQNHPEINLAFQPGTFQMKLGKEVLAGLYSRSNVFFCNKEEAQRILGTLENDAQKLLKTMHEIGPKIVVITDGPSGAYAYDGTEMWFMPPYPDPKPPYERTGAGDAFSSTFTVALALGLSIVEALMWAPINAMSVVQQVGAQAGLLNRSQITEYLAKAPKDYMPRLL